MSNSDEIPLTEVLAVARAIYSEAFQQYGGTPPCPSWCWDKASPEQKNFCTAQARAAIKALIALEYRKRP